MVAIDSRYLSSHRQVCNVRTNRLPRYGGQGEWRSKPELLTTRGPELSCMYLFWFEMLLIACDEMPDVWVTVISMISRHLSLFKYIKGLGMSQDPLASNNKENISESDHVLTLVDYSVLDNSIPSTVVSEITSGLCWPDRKRLALGDIGHTSRRHP